jgi:hypothetical protein
MLCYYKGELYLLEKTFACASNQCNAKYVCLCMNMCMSNMERVHVWMCRYTRMRGKRGDPHMSCIQVSCAWRNVWKIEIVILVAWVCWSLLYTSREKELSVLSSRPYLIESRIFLLSSATDWGKLAPVAREMWPAAARFSVCQLTGWVGQGDWSGWLSILPLPAAWIFPENIRENILLVGIRCTDRGPSPR